MINCKSIIPNNPQCYLVFHGWYRPEHIDGYVGYIDCRTHLCKVEVKIGAKDFIHYILGQDKELAMKYLDRRLKEALLSLEIYEQENRINLKEL